MADPLGRWLLGRDIRSRLAAFRRACEDPSILADLATLGAGAQERATIPPSS